MAALWATGLPFTAVAASCDGDGSSAPPDLPDPAELEALGARIGAIEIEVEDIFDPGKPGEGALPYRLANDLHVRTRTDAIRSQLLFDETQPYTRQ